jgi:hypothetical protein
MRPEQLYTDVQAGSSHAVYVAATEHPLENFSNLPAAWRPTLPFTVLAASAMNATTLRRDISWGDRDREQRYPAEDLVLAWELALWLRKSTQVTEI